MASRFGTRLFAQLARPSLRSSRQNVTPGKRLMSSSNPVSQEGDRPWQIGAAIVTGTSLLWLLSPSSKTKAHASKEHSIPKYKKASEPEVSTPLPVTDDEGTEVSAQEVEESLDKAFESNSPKDAQAAEEQQVSEGGSALTDAEGTVASPAEVNASTAQAFKEDSPKDAQASEEAEAGSASPGPREIEGQQGEKHSSEESSGPVDLGEARERSKAGETPKDAEGSE